MILMILWEVLQRECTGNIENTLQVLLSGRVVGNLCVCVCV